MIKRLKQWMKRRNAVASTALLERDPTEAETASACMYWRHDFGLMNEVDRAHLMWQAREWLHAWRKVNEDSSNTSREAR